MDVGSGHRRTSRQLEREKKMTDVGKKIQKIEPVLFQISITLWSKQPKSS